MLQAFNPFCLTEPNDRSNYWVLDTDYNNFAVVWQCEPKGENLSRENYWLLSRTKVLSTDTDVLARIAAVTDDLIIREEVRTTVHTIESCLGSVTPFAARNSGARLR
jgi:apolipoprotein D and lipocalin family protein